MENEVENSKRYYVIMLFAYRAATIASPRNGRNNIIT